MMETVKKIAITVFVYVAAIVAACFLSALFCLVFLHFDCCRLPGLWVYVAAALFTGYILVPTFLPFVAIGHVLLRKMPYHRYFPLVAIVFWGILFPLAGWVVDSRGWWPGEFQSMEATHFVALCAISVLALGAGVVAVFKLPSRGRPVKDMAAAMIAAERNMDERE